MLKKFLTTFFMFAMLAVMMPLAASTVNGQTRSYRTSSGQYVQYRKPSFYRRHRHLSNILIGTGAGALIGGLIGGRRGVGIGMLAGGGAGALYTYKLNPKTHRYYRGYRR